MKNLYQRSALKTRSERNEKQKLSKKTDHGSFKLFDHKELIVAVCSVLSPGMSHETARNGQRSLSSGGARENVCKAVLFLVIYSHKAWKSYKENFSSRHGIFSSHGFRFSYKLFSLVQCLSRISPELKLLKIACRFGWSTFEKTEIRWEWNF